MSAETVAKRLRDLGVPVLRIEGDSVLIAENVEVIVEPRRFQVCSLTPGKWRDTLHYFSPCSRIADLLPWLRAALGMEIDEPFAKPAAGNAP